MNHRKFGIKLGRNRREREALFKSLVRSIFTHGSIETTSAKAHSVVSIVEKLSNHIVTKDTLISQRELSTYIQDKALVSGIHSSFRRAFTDQTSNFTRIDKIKIRQGDDALIVRFSFVKPYKLELKPKVEVVESSKPAEVIKKTAKNKKVVTKKVKKI